MENLTENKIYLQGDLSSKFNITSIGTTPQDEKNIALDALDGDSSYIPRKDHFHHGEYKKVRKDRQDRKRRNFLQQILIIINQLQREIEANFQDIQNILDDLRKLCEETLEIIDNLNHQIDDMARDHEFVTNILDHSGEQGLEEEFQNRHVQALLNRYSERTGKPNSKGDDLRIILIAQIEYEQPVALPRLQQKLELATDLYEDSMLSIENIESQYNVLNDRHQKTNDVNDNDAKCNELEDIVQETDNLKTQTKSEYDALHDRFNQLESENSLNIEKNETTNSKVISNSKAVSLNKFGM